MMFGGPGHGPGGFGGPGFGGHRPPPPPPMYGGFRRGFRGFRPGYGSGCGCGCLPVLLFLFLVCAFVMFTGFGW